MLFFKFELEIEPPFTYKDNHHCAAFDAFQIHSLLDRSNVMITFHRMRITDRNAPPIQ